VDFALSEDQAAIATLAGDVFRAHGSDEHVRALAEAGRTFDAPLWRALLETGLVNLALPEAHGGSGQGMLELALVLEQQGKYLAAAPLWMHALATLAIATHADPSLQRRLLPELVAGTRVIGLATELEGNIGLHAVRDAEGWNLDGELDTVLVDASQDALLLPARTAEGTRMFLLPGELPGMTRTAGQLTDLQTVCDLHFARVHLARDSALDPVAADWLVPRMDTCIGALQLGVVQEALQRAADYVSQREQFGRPLGSFQALAVRAADAYIEVELLRSVVLQLAWRIDQGLPATAAARAAKFQSSQAGYIVGHTAQHFHGGVGADLTYPSHRFYLRSQALSHIGGSAEAQLALVGQALAGPEFEEYVHE
jgi:3-oxocholest-4-en-26-oyl-CoA dehydrogenase beta subunit